MRFARNPNLVAADMDGDMVMMSIEHGTYFGLTGIAPQIWEALEQPKSVGELVQELLPQFDVSADVLRSDIDAFLNDMHQNGLLHRP